MKPLLAHVYEPHRVTYPCYVQPKLNGVRALYQNGSFQSRDQLPFPMGLLEHLARPLLEVFGKETILDGELYVHGWSLQRINAAVTPVRQEPTEDTRLVEYHVFDVVDFNKPINDRRDILDCNDFRDAPIKFVETYWATDEALANSLYAKYVSLGYEGMMYRLGDCPYTVPKQTKESSPQWDNCRNSFNCQSKFLSDKDNRCWHLLKRKDWQDDEFECFHVVEGEGKLQGTLGALSCYVDNKRKDKPILQNSFSVGSGLTDSERAHYWSNPPIGRLIKVKYLCLSQDGIPLNPTILAIL